MTLNYKDFGAGKPLIILHGLFGTLDNWQTIARTLSADRLVYILDQRNHGRSPHTPDMNYELLCEDLKTFMEENWIFQADILGHSMGGKTVMQFALTYPEMVNKLIVVDIAPKKYVGGHEDVFKALFSIDLDSLETRRQAEEILNNQLKDKGTVQFLLKNLSRTADTGKFEWKMNLPALWQHYADIMADIPARADIFENSTLFIRGGNSHYVSDGDFQAALSRFPHAQLVTVENAGHWVHADKPNELMEIITNFIII
jgi:pimeloyl-ACP methyl ester carboxylesterase